MHDRFVDIESISDLHDFYGRSKPKHPLITVIDMTKVDRSGRSKDEVLYRLCFFLIFCKRFKGAFKYGKSSYDFNEGSLMFTAPSQVMACGPDIQIEEGWGLFFHPDLLKSSEPGKKISGYSFFHYDANEALHISEDEKQIIKECVENIKREYSQNIDTHTTGLILSNLDLLLNY